MATHQDDDTASSLGNLTRESSLASVKENIVNQRPPIESNDESDGIMAAEEKEPPNKDDEEPTRSLPANLSIRPYLKPPSDQLIQHLYRNALKDPNSDQSVLHPSGIVSFSDVVVPAVLEQTYDALGTMHSIIKRDHREYSESMTRIRKVFLQTARQTCEQLRQSPSVAQTLIQEGRRVVPVDPAEVARLKRSQNQHLWEEIAELMQAKVDLEEEKGKWENVRDNMRAKLEALRNQSNTEEEEATPESPAMETEEEATSEVSEDDKLMEKIQDVVTWMRTSAVRLADGLPDGEKLVSMTEERRKELYNVYKSKQQEQLSTGTGKLELLTQAFSTQDDDDTMDSL